MPLFYQHNINQDTKLGIWRIEEPESFFLEKVPLKRNVSHPYKRLQHLAGRYLLSFLFEDFPLEEIRVADTRQPFLASEKYHFSISHCGEYAAAIVSGNSRVGVDIEVITPRIETVARKFLTEDEAHYFNEEYALFLEQWGLRGRVHQEFLTMIWSAKEAIFKWYGRGELDFKRHMHLEGNITMDGDAVKLPFVFDKGKRIHLGIEGRIFDEQALILAWLLT
ncbi:4'-phosphopantetheinyl transferase superfamily protein [Flavitalea sp. BT771]|uniref:4'-phosphopantetheinyl transferase family protein n=1 Tax=Flavitalea sp. BT771 TaxID=3063329 RepID=UPI0026E2F672|nr:4'-phosphopantetheinyl transferase superfamily protein [Flavitalea sp. BT771]MDO6431011.1 4'-phosphopantetheinyl transferase superfamily protein [Flavitalea sp. BT771]MDV6219918.1 4'-phosphopantetheinyl transferase superfamily protein [Flavitalea sp. BT771]